MAGGPIFPHSAIPVTTGNVFPNIYVGGGANSKHDQGLGVIASLAADSIWRLRFKMPPTALPSGTCKLHLQALANATTGVAKVNPKWATIANTGVSPSGATLIAEGTTTVTWSTGDNDKYIESKITLDANTPAADNTIVMDLVFETTSWTLAQVSTWIASIIWE